MSSGSTFNALKHFYHVNFFDETYHILNYYATNKLLPHI